MAAHNVIIEGALYINNKRDIAKRGCNFTFMTANGRQRLMTSKIYSSRSCCFRAIRTLAQQIGLIRVEDYTHKKYPNVIFITGKRK